MKTEAFIRARVVERIKELRERQEVPYKELARRLEGMGVRIDAKLLAKRINRGAFTFSFGVAVLMALGETSFDFPTLPGKRKN